MIFLFNYIKLGIWSSIYYFQKQKSEIVFDIIVQNIKNSGCIALKFVQWILPKIENIYDIDRKDSKNEWFTKLESIYENCNYHSLDYTKYIYQKEFNKKLEDEYTIVRKLASGSIGQVYQIKDKNGKLKVLKVLHPNIHTQVIYFQFLINCIIFFPFIRRKFYSIIPLNLSNFISDFKMQTNLISEANNCLQFYENYKDNPYIIIPQIYRMSQNILIMSYEEGESFYDLDISEYTQCKLILLFKLFNKNNESITHFIHGDLHRGNWKVRFDEGKNDYVLVVYDFGFCWELPNFISENIDFINRSFLKILDTSNEINNFSKACWLFLDKKCDLEVIKKDINLYLREEKLCRVEEPQFLLNLILKISTKEGIVIDSYCMQCIILYNQLWKLYEDFNMIPSPSWKSDKNLYEDYYINRIYDIINYCDTKNIFLEYKNYLEIELEEEKKISPFLKKTSLNIINNDKIFDSIKHLCN